MMTTRELWRDTRGAREHEKISVKRITESSYGHEGGEMSVRYEFDVRRRRRER